LKQYEKKKELYDQRYKKPPARQPIKLENPSDQLEGHQGGSLSRRAGNSPYCRRKVAYRRKLPPEAKPEPKKDKEPGETRYVFRGEEKRRGAGKNESKQPPKTEPKAPDKA